jgi:hypothetical protein
MNLLGIAVQIIVGIIIIAPVLWVAGRVLVGHKAKFSHAIWIVVLGIIIGVIIGALVGNGLLSAVIMFFVWLYLIKHFFECGWLHAFAIAIIAVIIFIVIAAILVALGIGIVGLGLAGL